MKPVCACLIVISLLLSVAGLSKFNDHSHGHHDHEMSAQEHAALDTDSEGNAHKGSDHFHLTNHLYLEIGVFATAADFNIESSILKMSSAWKESFYLDYSAPPLLDPPLSA